MARLIYIWVPVTILDGLNRFKCCYAQQAQLATVCVRRWLPGCSVHRDGRAAGAAGNSTGKQTHRVRP
jgi:hypothetical protein